ncbi:DNA/RNA nuclease SfsA [Pontibacillus salicampi]|uniref:Sugar fermentation stimulation protein homolog n=1 Tax=Pontibacillus salicampi TaxID=1449801 RepID=A0ABV6LLL9_9BACI
MIISIPLPHPLYEAELIERENRFILSCRLKETKEEIRVHLADPGRLKELLPKGCLVYVSHHPSPQRKTNWSAVLVKDMVTQTLVSLQTTLPNHLIEKGLKEHSIPPFQSYDFQKREFTYGGSRWDFLLQKDASFMALEVKSVTLQQDGIGYFPDAVSKRATKHVRELARIQEEEDWEAAILFVCQREDIQVMKRASWIDPEFSLALQQAREKGVHIHAVQSHLSKEAITLGEEIPFIWD